jgi:hypothetical protein
VLGVSAVRFVEMYGPDIGNFSPAGRRAVLVLVLAAGTVARRRLVDQFPRPFCATWLWRPGRYERPTRTALTIGGMAQVVDRQSAPSASPPPSAAIGTGLVGVDRRSGLIREPRRVRSSSRASQVRHA